MQWLIDLIAERVLLKWQGMIVAWSGAIVDIPDGWALCDGNNGTPDLTDKFIMGAGDTYNPGVAGGQVNHTHDFTGDGHDHLIPSGKNIVIGTGYNQRTESDPAVGTTDQASGLPPYWALAFIMKL